MIFSFCILIFWRWLIDAERQVYVPTETVGTRYVFLYLEFGNSLNVGCSVLDIGYSILCSTFITEPTLKAIAQHEIWLGDGSILLLQI